jgi:alkylhydroperoxidase/carboxymuconolactone decarboxylase family protein YurZ
MVGTLGRLMGLNFEADICAKLYNDCGGHPFLIRQMCSFIHNSYKGERPFKVDKGTYTIALESYQANLEQYFDMMLNILCTWYPDEYEMLIMLALEDNETFIELAKDNKSLVQHLLSFGLVEKNYNEKYMLSLESLGEYLKNKNKFKKITLSDEEKLQEISLRRNRLEKKLRELILNGLKFAYGKKALNELLKAIPEAKRDTLRIQTINEILGNNSPLYLLDLKNILNQNWDKFLNFLCDFEKQRFLIMLDDINKYRVDAHAKDIEDEDFKQLRIHFDKLEKLEM